MAGICALLFLFLAHTKDAISSCSLVVQVGECLIYSNCCYPVIHAIWWDLQLLKFGSHLTPMLLILDGGGSSFPGLVPPDNAVNSYLVLAVKSGVSGVMLGYQIANFTHIC